MIDYNYPVIFTVAIVDPPFDVVNNEPSYERLEDLIFQQQKADQSWTIDLPKRLLFSFYCPPDDFAECLKTATEGIEAIVAQYVSQTS